MLAFKVGFFVVQLVGHINRFQPLLNWGDTPSPFE